MSQTNQVHINWTKQEWTAVAQRAAANKKSMADKSWTQIILVSQDDIKPERRRFYFTRPESMKPMFDILGLDALGNPKPPPPPPPKPAPAPAPAVPAVDVAKSAPALGPNMPSPMFATPLTAVPVEALVGELFRRGTQLKEHADKALAANAEVQSTVKKQREELHAYVQRVEAVEKMIQDCMDNMDTVEAAHRDVMETRALVDEQFRIIIDHSDKIMKALGAVQPENRQSTLRELGANMLADEAVAVKTFMNPPPREPLQRLAPIRFLLVGRLHDKDIAHIRQRLPRSLNVDLLIGENTEHIKMPANVHYCLVSGDGDFTKRWQQALSVYGKDKVHRMANGSIGTFANQVQILSSQHHPSPNGKG